VGVDEGGIKVGDMEGKDMEGVKLVHVTPSCHYPLGMSMSLERRQALLDWARRHKALVIENDYEHEVHNYGGGRPALFSMDKTQRTIYMSTFNRLLHPSIRVGYMVVPFYLLDAVEALMKHSHRFVPPSTQVVLNQFIEKKYLHNHIRNVVKVAEERKAIFDGHFLMGFGDKVKLDGSKVRSLHAVARLPQGVSDKEVVAAFSEANIVVHALSKCFVGAEKEQGLIMGFASVRIPLIRRTLAQMADVYKARFG
jgi:GntR family transcriptional regulator/MocR family aminotransferase